MKKKYYLSFFIILVFIFFSNHIFSADKVKFGIKDGFNISGHWSNKDSKDDSVKSRFTSGYLIGIAARFKLSDHLKLQPEILYFRKGSKQDVTIPGSPIGTLYVKYNLNYIEFPITLKWYFLNAKGSVQPHFSFGGYFAYLMKGNYTVSNSFIGDIEEDLDGLKSTDVGFISGSGVDFKIKKLVFSLQYRYSMGFVDLDLPTGPGAPTIALRNYNHALTLGIFF